MRLVPVSFPSVCSTAAAERHSPKSKHMRRSATHHGGKMQAILLSIALFVTIWLTLEAVLTDVD
jgi:hypothetical protein